MILLFESDMYVSTQKPEASIFREPLSPTVPLGKLNDPN